jgi:hypothetical protein
MASMRSAAVGAVSAAASSRGRVDDALLDLGDLGLAQRWQRAAGIDIISHAMQYNCIKCTSTALGA